MPPKTQAPETSDYKNLIALLAIFSDLSNQLKSIAVQANEQYLEAVDGVIDDFAKLKQKLDDAQRAIELLVLSHRREWFGDGKTLKTPYGDIKFRASTKLEVSNEEVTILLLERDADKIGGTPDQFIKTEKKLDLEALEKLTDQQLAFLRIRRVENESLSIVPKEVDMGKVAQQAAERRAA